MIRPINNRPIKARRRRGALRLQRARGLLRRRLHAPPHGMYTHNRTDRTHGRTQVAGGRMSSCPSCNLSTFISGFFELLPLLGIYFRPSMKPALKGPSLLRKQQQQQGQKTSSSSSSGLLWHASHFQFGVGHVKYVTLLREPVHRVVSEFFWGCSAKVNKKFTGEHEGKVLFDWPRKVIKRQTE